MIQSHKNTERILPHMKQHRVTPHTSPRQPQTGTHLASERKTMPVAVCGVVHSSRRRVKTTSSNTARHGNRVYRPGFSSGSVDTTHGHEKLRPTHHGNLVYKPNQDTAETEARPREVVECTHAPSQTVGDHDPELSARITEEACERNPHCLLPPGTSFISPGKKTQHKKQYVLCE